MQAGVEILWEDEALVVINKPSGLPVHRSREVGRGENAMANVRDLVGAWVHPVHRLDRATSGALLFSKDRELIPALKLQFDRQTVVKHYLAIVRGRLASPMRVDRELRNEETGIFQNCSTEFAPLGYFEAEWPGGKFARARYGLILARPETGRRHQIRRHLRGLDHPIINDSAHGDTRQNKAFREQTGISRLLLHAMGLEFTHPLSGERLKLEAPLDDQMEGLFTSFGWSLPRLSPV